MRAARRGCKIEGSSECVRPSTKAAAISSRTARRAITGDTGPSRGTVRGTMTSPFYFEVLIADSGLLLRPELGDTEEDAKERPKCVFASRSEHLDLRSQISG